jgi:hypothetical protein
MLNFLIGKSSANTSSFKKNFFFFKFFFKKKNKIKFKFIKSVKPSFLLKSKIKLYNFFLKTTVYLTEGKLSSFYFFKKKPLNRSGFFYFFNENNKVVEYRILKTKDLKIPLTKKKQHYFKKIVLNLYNCKTRNWLIKNV